MPLVAVWASCERCHFVWRASLLDTMKEIAARGARRTVGEKVVDRYSPEPPVQGATNDAVSLKPLSDDRVAEWLASQENPATLKLAPIVPGSAEIANAAADPVEDFFDRLEPTETQTRANWDTKIGPAANDFYAFFAEDDASIPERDESVERWIDEPAVVAIVEPVPVPEPPPVVQAVTISAPLEDSVDRALTNVEDLYDAFKRLEEQLGGMEKWCAELANSK
jgi:hypothetical protein